MSYFSGIVDEHDAVHGGRPAPCRRVLGLTVEEFSRCAPADRPSLDGGSRADVWTESVVPRERRTVCSYVDGPAAGQPAVTRHAFGDGQAWYVSTRLHDLDRRSPPGLADADLTTR